MIPTLTSKFDSRHRYLLLAFTLLAFTGTQADYIIDDNDTSVIYSSNHGAKSWSLLSPTTNLTVLSANNSMITFDYNRFYNQTACVDFHVFYRYCDADLKSFQAW
jgi:hypothetical protein